MSVCLTIKEIERLAVAGVKVEIESVIPIHDPDPPAAVRSMEDAVWDRWNRTKASTYDINWIERPFKLMASQHGENIWVSVHPTSFNYEPFQLRDQAPIFPSDALMAQLALWEANHK